MSKFKIILPDTENKNKARAFGEWEDTKENRERLSEWYVAGYIETQDNYVRAWDGCFYKEGHEPLKPIDDLKIEKKAEINKARDEEEQGGFEYLGKIFDSDQVSAQRISMAAQSMAGLTHLNPEPIITWTTQDNTTIDLTASQLQELVIALANHSNNCHKKAANLKKLIDEAQTNDEVEVIVW